MDGTPADWHKTRCEALTKAGKQCRRQCQAYFPCQAIHDARASSFRATEFRPVHLCYTHAQMALDHRQRQLRLPLVQRGFFGPYNRHGYGNLVTTQKLIDWDNPKLTIPRSWATTPQSNPIS